MNHDPDSTLAGLIHDHLEGTLTPARLAELEALLRSSAAARKAFWELTELHGLVHEAEKTRWSAQDGEIVEVRSRPRTQGWWRGPALGWAAAASVLAVIGAQMWRQAQRSTILSSPPSPNGFVAELRSAEQAVWEPGSAAPQVREALQAGLLELRSGTIELSFFNGATVAVRGPARWRLLAPDRMALESGRLSADVPERAIGFVVETPASSVRDLGTRFGVAVGADRVTETHVFEGAVDVTPSPAMEELTRTRRLDASGALELDPARGAVRTIMADQSAFPLPERIESIPVPGGDFEPDEAGWGANDAQVPTTFGVWSGDYAHRVGSEHGIVPKSGRGMLHFISAMREDTPPSQQGGAAERWCWLDLRALRHTAKGRQLTADFSAWFNRLSGPPEGTCTAKVIIAAYGASAIPGPAAWAQRLQHGAPMKALANSEVLLSMDDDVRTWEQAFTRLNIPAEAVMLLLSVRTQGEDDTPNWRFADVYADAVELTLRHGNPVLSGL